MKIHIVNYEEPRYNGILSKYAYKMKEELEKLKVKVFVSNTPDPKADINHHINYRSYKPSGTIDTLMVTHITTEDKMDSLVKGMKTAKKGICFSQDTEHYLTAKGIKNLCTILPAHDGYPRRPRRILITTNVYPDGCKREWMFYELLKNIDCEKFQFYIMGSGWNVAGLNANISYLDHFEKDDYESLLNTCDYNLYFGQDEGSMGILDAANVGMKTIAPLQGFHKEIGIDYPFETQEELNAIFKKLEANPVKDWTWGNYVKQHCSIWKKLLEQKNVKS
jgi:hypothetical protein